MLNIEPANSTSKLPIQIVDFINKHKGSMIKGHLDIRLCETLTDQISERKHKIVDMFINISFDNITVNWIKQHEHYDLPLGENLFDSDTTQSFNWVSNSFSQNGIAFCGMNEKVSIDALTEFADMLANLNMADFTVYQKPTNDQFILSSNPGIQSDTKFVILDWDEFPPKKLREIRAKNNSPYFSSKRELEKLITTEGLKTRCFDTYTELLDKLNSSMASLRTHSFVEIDIKKPVLLTDFD